ncbi:MAG: enolase C-terminal domain-like protein [Rhodoferax sp.]
MQRGAGRAAAAAGQLCRTPQAAPGHRDPGAGRRKLLRRGALRELLLQDCCDAVTLYPGKQGGIAKARRLAAIAADAGVPCTIGSNLEWDIGAAAMMQFVVATPNVQIEQIPGDCLGPSYHAFSIVRDPLKIEGAFTTLRPEPGLGVEVDWDQVERHRIRG